MTTKRIEESAITWRGNPTHSGNHTFKGDVTVESSLDLEGLLTLTPGDAPADIIKIENDTDPDRIIRSRWTGSAGTWNLTPSDPADGSNNFARELGYDFDEERWFIEGPLDLGHPNAGQIIFPSNQNSSSDANTLDDYEEGNWTPDLTDGTNSDAAFSSQAGDYTKTGNIVFFQGQLILTSLGSLSGAIDIAGLPFTAGNNGGDHNGSFSVTVARGLNITAGNVVAGSVFDNSTRIDLQLWDSAGGQSSFEASELSANGRIDFGGFYYV